MVVEPVERPVGVVLVNNLIWLIVEVLQII
jgi:hypothetical protein